MLGAASTGKTSLSERYITGIFNPNIKLTVGVDFYVKTVNMKDKSVKLQIWDMGGEERFRFLLPTYALGSSGALFLIDVTRPDTLNEMNDWISIVRSKNGKIPIIFVANKVDLKENRKVSTQTLKEICEENSFAEFYETSAKIGTNVEDVFRKLTELMLKQVNSNQNNNSEKK